MNPVWGLSSPQNNLQIISNRNIDNLGGCIEPPTANEQNLLTIKCFSLTVKE